jgi:hypothetical protein
VAVTADGTTALSGGGTVRVWNLITGQVRATLTGQDGTTAVTGADGRHDRRRLRIGEHGQHTGRFSIALQTVRGTRGVVLGVPGRQLSK